MAYPLSTRDIHVLEKIKDPESDPSAGVAIDRSLPADPHVKDQSTYLKIVQQEKEVIFPMQSLELQIAGQRPSSGLDVVEEYRRCVTSLDDLIKSYPDYASARNNRAQALRRLYGDSMLVEGASPFPQVLIRDAEESERMEAARTVLLDLDRSVALLSPDHPKASLSAQAAKTLSMAHTQRAAIYHMTSKLLASGRSVSLDSSRREAAWGRLEFEEAASRDFALGGRYGNEIAKGLAVSTNPTAKLCGQIVREAMKKEYGPAFGVCDAE
ncbi:Tetratricopeptide repeat protein 36-like protein [Coniochaeta hoffmannii]|uniref:Tetratricopeptide repeat protein 36-like protein n=1 Tax=Coniochaeta hoffmannii TaxID=91930 RepID=A0AA38W1F7_9PEZI|nr:Tetratricopeptide repeat protein 36-like protein [Coniochaeta hoffmannii]